MGRDSISGDDEAHGQDNQQNSAADPRSQGLSENRHTEKYGRYGFERAQNSRGRRTDVLNGAGRAKKRYRRRENGQGDEISPQVPTIRNTDGAAEIQPDEKQRQPEQKDIKSHFERRDGFQRRTVHPDDINGVSERRNHHQDRPCKVERRAVGALIEQRDTAQRQQDTQRRLRGEFLPKAEGHNQRHEDRVDEQQRRGYAGIHVVITQEQGQRGEGDQQPQDNQRQNLPAAQPETAPAGLKHNAQNRNREKIPEKQHRIGIHAGFIEREGEQRVHPVGSRRDSSQQIAFGFCIHTFDFAAKIAFIPTYG